MFKRSLIGAFLVFSLLTSVSVVFAVGSIDADQTETDLQPASPLSVSPVSEEFDREPPGLPRSISPFWKAGEEDYDEERYVLPSRSPSVTGGDEAAEG